VLPNAYSETAFDDALHLTIDLAESLQFQEAEINEEK
jgi:hypothetical protein